MTTTDRGPVPLGPIAQLRAGRLPRRVGQLLVGLALYGATLAMIVRSAWGNAPWDVLHQGLAQRLPLSFGSALILTSVVVLLLWVPLRERPGLGTVANALLVGLAADATLAVLSTPDSWVLRTLLLVVGVAGNATATAIYLGAGLGSGPRDGLMTGLHRRTSVAIGVVRTGLETTVVVLGFVLGGLVGVGTLVYALAIGPLTQLLLPSFVVVLAPPAPSGVSDASR